MDASVEIERFWETWKSCSPLSLRKDLLTYTWVKTQNHRPEVFNILTEYLIHSDQNVRTDAEINLIISGSWVSRKVGQFDCFEIEDEIFFQLMNVIPKEQVIQFIFFANEAFCSNFLTANPEKVTQAKYGLWSVEGENGLSEGLSASQWQEFIDNPDYHGLPPEWWVPMIMNGVE